MKKILIIALMIALTVQFASAAATGAAAAAGVNLNISLLKYEPVPAHPGDILDVWLQLENNGADVARNLEMEFQDNYPFSLENDQRRVHKLGTLSGGYDYVAKFQVRVDQGAPTGISYVKARFRKTDQDRWKEYLMPIEIESRITSLSIDSIETQPERISPGQRGTLKVNVENIADSKMRDITATLDLEDSDAPISPTSSSTELKIDSLEPGEKHTFEFNLVAQLDAEANAYNIPLDITFKNDKGEEIEYNNLVGVLISSEPEMVITVDSSNIYSDQPNGKVTLKFVNKGLDEIKFVYFTLEDHESYQLLAPTNKYYVGNIDTDDYEIEEIQLEANSKDKITLPVSIQYRDAMNDLYQMKEEITLNLVNREEVEEQQSNTGTWVIVILIAAGIGIYFWRRKKKSRQR